MTKTMNLLKLNAPLNINVETKMAAFSDTIIVTCAAPSSQKQIIPIHLLVEYVGILLSNIMIMALITDIHLRGAISLGEFYMVDDMMIGPAIDESAQYYELPEWVGISATPSIRELLNNLPSDKLDTRTNFVNVNIPLKIGQEKNGWAINWPAYLASGALDEETDKITDKVYHQLKKIIGRQLLGSDMTTVLKWRNTDDFFNQHYHPPKVNT